MKPLDFEALRDLLDDFQWACSKGNECDNREQIIRAREAVLEEVRRLVKQGTR